jgi:hypothetical protein
VGYESVPGKGTTVVVDLPRCALSAPGAQKRLPKPLCDKVPAGALLEPVFDAARAATGSEVSPEPSPVEAATEEPAPAR